MNQVEADFVRKGLFDIYTIEENGSVFIGGRSDQKINSEMALLVDDNLSIDWENQWKEFATGFTNGKAHIDLRKYGANKILKLLPGSGFGDLSHPTTQLMLEMMEGKVQGKTVYDIGSGSGILTLGSVFLGAKWVHGVEIDPKAISHAKKNAELNGLEKMVKFSNHLPKKIESSPLLLMNMILTDQMAFDPSKVKGGTWIVSGITVKEKNEYLPLSATWGFSPQEEFEKNGWMGWIFNKA